MAIFHEKFIQYSASGKDGLFVLTGYMHRRGRGIDLLPTIDEVLVDGITYGHALLDESEMEPFEWSKYYNIYK